MSIIPDDGRRSLIENPHTPRHAAREAYPSVTASYRSLLSPTGFSRS